MSDVEAVVEVLVETVKDTADVMLVTRRVHQVDSTQSSSVVVPAVDVVLLHHPRRMMVTATMHPTTNGTTSL